MGRSMANLLLIVALMVATLLPQRCLSMPSRSSRISQETQRRERASRNRLAGVARPRKGLLSVLERAAVKGNTEHLYEQNAIAVVRFCTANFLSWETSAELDVILL